MMSTLIYETLKNIIGAGQNQSEPQRFVTFQIYSSP